MIMILVMEVHVYGLFFLSDVCTLLCCIVNFLSHIF